MLGIIAIAALLSQPSGYAKCVKRIDMRGLVISQMLDCATREMGRADATLNREYRAVLKKTSPGFRLRLVRDERAWISERRRRCLAAEAERLPSPDVNRMLCLVRETDARTALLRTER